MFYPISQNILKSVIACVTLLFCIAAKAQTNHQIGFSIGINALTPQKLKQISDAKIDCVETGLTAYINQDSLTFKFSEEEIISKMKAVKKAADDAGVAIWSIHMPFGKAIDISFVEEDRRKKVIAFQRQVLQFVKILEPKIILFHPSYYLGINEREERIMQMVKSVHELNGEVKAFKATMVIENMLGPALLTSDGRRERPLMRTLEETVTIFKKLPDDVYAAVDLNHISKPEEMLLALGKRVKTLHVADGDGKAERHYFPCEHKGENNWKAIFEALAKINYKGPFMYESVAKDLNFYRACYEELGQLNK